jgi:hypothetical protein
MDPIEELPVWKTSIYKVAKPDFHTIKSDVIDMIYGMDKDITEKDHEIPFPSYGIGPFHQRHKKRLSESYGDLFTRYYHLPLMKDLSDWFLEQTIRVAAGVNKGFTNTDNWQAQYTSTWYHITQDGGYHDYHNHGDSAWCGIFYVSKAKSNWFKANGVNRFYTPAPQVDGIKGLEFQRTSYDIEPEDGTLYIFPGFIPHSALPYYGNEDRIILSFNTRIVEEMDPESPKT